jgi:DNA-binding GntR family transcriptional regulator
MTITLDRRSKTPLSQQLEFELRLRLIHGELHQNTAMPLPSELALELNITPQQVEEAYNSLVFSKHLVRKNEDWLVSYGRIPKQVFEKYISLFEILKEFGSNPKIETLSVKNDYKLPKGFEIEIPFKKVLYTRRVYLSHDRPQVLVDCYFPQDLYPGLDKLLLSNEPYYALLKSVYGLEFGRSDRTFEAENLRKQEAEILGVPAKSTYCYSIARTYDTLGRLVEVDVCWILPDLLHFSIEQDE